MDIYNKNTSTVVAEAVYQLIKGGMYGALWGCVTPFHPITSTSPQQGSIKAVATAAASGE